MHTPCGEPAGVGRAADRRRGRTPSRGGAAGERCPFDARGLRRASGRDAAPAPTRLPSNPSAFMRRRGRGRGATTESAFDSDTVRPPHVAGASTRTVEAGLPAWGVRFGSAFPTHRGQWPCGDPSVDRSDSSSAPACPSTSALRRASEPIRPSRRRVRGGFSPPSLVAKLATAGTRSRRTSNERSITPLARRHLR